jgi:hypothetical protein
LSEVERESDDAILSDLQETWMQAHGRIRAHGRETPSEHLCVADARDTFACKGYYRLRGVRMSHEEQLAVALEEIRRQNRKILDLERIIADLTRHPKVMRRDM